ncbi:hypothetical protein TgHK011_002267 [Trichoderma gracile]|nr:hypothetical protein TgHK011_002267 [Trichoderma gracile]
MFTCNLVTDEEHGIHLQGTMLRSPVRGAREMGLRVVAMRRLSCRMNRRNEPGPGSGALRWGSTKHDE